MPQGRKGTTTSASFGVRLAGAIEVGQINYKTKPRRHGVDLGGLWAFRRPVIGE